MVLGTRSDLLSTRVIFTSWGRVIKFAASCPIPAWCIHRPVVNLTTFSVRYIRAQWYLYIYRCICNCFVLHVSANAELPEHCATAASLGAHVQVKCAVTASVGAHVQVKCAVTASAGAHVQVKCAVTASVTNLPLMCRYSVQQQQALALMCR